MIKNIQLLKTNNNHKHYLDSIGVNKIVNSSLNIVIEYKPLLVPSQVDEILVHIPIELIRYWLGHSNGGLRSLSMPHINLEASKTKLDVWSTNSHVTIDDDKWFAWFVYWLASYYDGMHSQTIIFEATHEYWLLHDLLHVYHDAEDSGAKIITVEEEYKRHQQAFALCILNDIEVSSEYLDSVSQLFETKFDYPIEFDVVKKSFLD